MELEHFVLESFNFYNIDHKTIAVNIYNDKDCYMFLGDVFEYIEYIYLGKQDEITNVYVVKEKENDNYIGIIGIYSRYDNTFDLMYAISKEYRNRGLGTILLTEFSEKIKECNIEKLVLIISENNIASKKIALKSDFVQETKYKFEKKLK